MISFNSPEDLQIHFETAHVDSEPSPPSGVRMILIINSLILVRDQSLNTPYLFLTNSVMLGDLGRKSIKNRVLKFMRDKAGEFIHVYSILRLSFNGGQCLINSQFNALSVFTSLF